MHFFKKSFFGRVGSTKAQPIPIEDNITASDEI
jgi:hypothetical protein